MKKIGLLVYCMYAFACYSQTVLEVTLPTDTTKTTKLVSVKNKSIDSLNLKLRAFQSNPTKKSFDSLVSAVKDTSIKSMPGVQTIKDSLGFNKQDSIISVPTKPTEYNKIARKKIDSAKSIDSLDTITTNNKCPILQKAKIKYLLGDNDDYIGVIEDTTGLALKTFALIQSNKALFYDKFTKALNSLCSDTASVNSTIREYKNQDPDFYTQYLEAKEKLDNTDELAGTLTITKNTIISNDEYLKSRYNGLSGMDYPNLKSIRKAKRESRKLLELTIRLRKQLDTLLEHALIAEKRIGAKSYAADVQRLANEVRDRVNSARIYRDSINFNVPEEIVLYYYNKSIQGLKSAAQLAVIALTKSLTLPPDSSNFSIREIQVQFQDGFIENIKIFGKLKGRQELLRFENIYPIGFSTKRDFRNFVNIDLFEKSDYHRNSWMVLKLADVISYNQNLANDNKDYSPGNQVLTIKALSDSIKEVPLYKDQTSKILELQVFSDLKGADNNNPNGLIQIVLNKRLNFFSQRYNMTWAVLPWHWFSQRTFENVGNFGVLNYITPQFTIDKIENNQKRLIIDRIDNLSLAADSSKPITYASTINLLRHQIYSVGLDLSLMLVDLPSLKSIFNFGTGIHFGRTAIEDTLRVRGLDTASLIFHAAPTNNVQDYGVNTFQWGPYFTWQIFPDSRFGISTTQRFTWFKALTDNFVQVRDSAHYLKFIAGTPKAQLQNTPYSYFDYGRSNDWFVKNIASPHSLFTRCIASTEIFAYFNPGKNGNNKLFFRYRFNWDIANPRENFHQMQVGFSTYLTATTEYDKLKKSANFE